MNSANSSIILIGVGGAGAMMVRSVVKSYAGEIRTQILDTNARSGEAGDLPFVLLGGNRLAGHGAGGNPASARAAFQDNPALLDTSLSGVRTAIIVTGLGGGTGSGATGELLKHLHMLGIVTLLFATRPFEFEGPDRVRTANTAVGSTSQQADVSVIVPLGELLANTGTDNMEESLRRGLETLSSGITLLLRLVEQPGYIQLDSERLRNVLMNCGRAHFATATATGDDRANVALRAIAEHPLLQFEKAKTPIRTMLVGVLAGEDLRLSEISNISAGLIAAFSPKNLELGTVNDENTFSGRLSVVMLAFEESSAINRPVPGYQPRKPSSRQTLGDASHFPKTEANFYNDEDLDIPTYIRHNLTLDR